ncbi:RNA-directed DNA polymerase, eukaryota [Tanacetum coccineum]
MSFYRSKEDHVAHISKSIFVTNFPDNFGSRDLWKLCEAYGKVVDVYIPNRKYKAGKRFAFVCFIKVVDLDRLVGNLCTLWVGRFHIHANVVRFERPSNISYVPLTSPSTTSSLLLDDSCVYVRDLSRHVMGKVKDLNSISNLWILLDKEGFPKLKLTYLGGMWVMIELINEPTKLKLLQHVGVQSWFHVLQAAADDFVSEEHVVWVDIEGVPLNVWSRETFLKIGKIWGETMDIEENLVSSFARKRLYIITKKADNILEKFKIVFKGEVYMDRVKELFAWTLNFLDLKESEYVSDDEAVLGDNNKSVRSQHGDDGLVDDSDGEGVLKTIFDDNHTSHINSACSSGVKADKQQSEVIFRIYDLLQKNPKGAVQESEPSLSHPPGFTLEAPQQEEDHSNDDQNNDTDKPNSPLVHSKVMNTTEEVHENVLSNGESGFNYSHNSYKGGSILEVLDDMIRVGQSIGYEMVGCIKDIEHIIGTQGADVIP